MHVTIYVHTGFPKIHTFLKNVPDLLSDDKGDKIMYINHFSNRAYFIYLSWLYNKYLQGGVYKGPWVLISS